MLIEAFREGADFHERTALKIFGADSGRDPHELRSIAKMVNYALLYGKTRVHAVQRHRRHHQAAQEFIDAYFAGFPASAPSRSHARRGPRDRRRQDDVRAPPAGAGSQQPQLPGAPAAERMAVNMPIQGTAADILKRAMIDVHAALVPHAASARMILTVHDELLFEGRGARRRNRRDRPPEDAGRPAQRAADGRCRDRRKLERRKRIGNRAIGELPIADSGLPALLELLPLGAQCLGRLRRRSRPFGHEGAHHQSVDVVAQRGAALWHQRRAYPGRLGGVPPACVSPCARAAAASQ